MRYDSMTERLGWAVDGPGNLNVPLIRPKKSTASGYKKWASLLSKDVTNAFTSDGLWVWQVLPVVLVQNLKNNYAIRCSYLCPGHIFISESRQLTCARGLLHRMSKFSLTLGESKIIFLCFVAVKKWKRNWSIRNVVFLLSHPFI
jgi:hypothetical protein